MEDRDLVIQTLAGDERAYRRSTPVQSLDPDVMPGSGPAPDEVYRRNEVQRRVLAALGGLSEKDREAVILYYLDERSIAEIGRSLGVNAGAVKGRLYRARQHLRREMVDMAKKMLSQKQLGPEFAEKVELQKFGDLAQLTDEELKKLMDEKLDAGMGLVYALRSDDPGARALMARILETLPSIFYKVDTKDLAAALKSQVSGMQKVRERCFANVSERVRKLMQAEQTYGEIPEAETREAQEHILKIVHQMQEAGEIRAGKKG